jgi:SAM-dependent methyltransferase
MRIPALAASKYKRDGVVELLRSGFRLGKHRIVFNLPRSLRSKLIPMKSRGELHEYWESRSDAEEIPFDAKNLPESYLTDSGRSEFLFDIISKHTEKSDAILELGCNVGRNLHFLHKNGYRNLHSIEINAYALELLNKEFPQLNEDAEIYNSPIENQITEFEDNEFDTCFTMAVLEHMHPESEWIFQEIVRVSSSYIILIEDEMTISWRHEPRRYAELFTDLGCELIETIPNNEFPENVKLGIGFKAHILQPQ